MQLGVAWVVGVGFVHSFRVELSVVGVIVTIFVLHFAMLVLHFVRVVFSRWVRSVAYSATSLVC